MKEVLKIKGIPHFRLNDAKGNVIREWSEENLVTEGGRNYFAKKISDDFTVADSRVGFIALGDDDTAAQTTNTQMNNEMVRFPITFKRVLNSVVSFIGGSNQEDGEVFVREAGLWTDDEEPILLCHLILENPFVKLDSEFLTVDWRIQIG